MAETRIRLRLDLTLAQLSSLSAVKRDLADSTAFQSTGAEVTDAAALRFILYEALEARKYRDFPADPPGRPLIEVLGPEMDAEEAKTGRESGKTAPKRPEPLIPEVIAPEIYDRPREWDYFDVDPWELPDSQGEMHNYYADAGWTRVAAPLQDRLLEFYWNPVTALQDLTAWNGTDAYGRAMGVQNSPDLGTAHLVPEDWGEDRGDIGDVGMWQP
tara:strand:- start:851 stop:1495 length:645 start_codon:yes stop_codon:yes gene_type:complete